MYQMSCSVIVIHKWARLPNPDLSFFSLESHYGLLDWWWHHNADTAMTWIYPLVGLQIGLAPSTFSVCRHNSSKDAHYDHRPNPHWYCIHEFRKPSCPYVVQSRWVQDNTLQRGILPFSNSTPMSCTTVSLMMRHCTTDAVPISIRCTIDQSD